MDLVIPPPPFFPLNPSSVDCVDHYHEIPNPSKTLATNATFSKLSKQKKKKKRAPVFPYFCESC